jgi:hypothetical protein
MLQGDNKMTNESGYSLADLAAIVKNNDHPYGYGYGFQNSEFFMLILFFAIFGGWGNGGFGGWGNNGFANGALTRAELTEGFNNQSVLRKLDGITQGLCDGFYANNTTMLQGFNGLGSQIASCCCETNRNIDNVRYEAAKNTCDIVRAIEKDGDATRALINQNTMDMLRAKLVEKDQMLQTATFQLSQQAQNSYLLNELRPVSKPAYITCSPYEASAFYRNGCCGY